MAGSGQLSGLGVEILGYGFAKRVDSTSTPNITYIGIAQPGTADADAFWAISTVDTSILAADVKWANGNNFFLNVWDDRTSLTYL